LTKPSRFAQRRLLHDFIPSQTELETVDIGKQLERVKWFLWHGTKIPL
jgi:hypothetical protein